MKWQNLIPGGKSTTDHDGRRGALKAVGAGTAIALTGGLASCGSKNAIEDQEWLFVGRVGEKEEKQQASDMPAQLKWQNSGGDKEGLVQLNKELELKPDAYETVVIGKVNGTHAIPAKCKDLFLPQGSLNGANEMHLRIDGTYDFSADLFSPSTRASSVVLEIPGTDINKEPRQLNVDLSNRKELPNVYFYNDKYEIIGGIRGKQLTGMVESYAPPEKDASGYDNYEPANRIHENDREYQPIVSQFLDVKDVFLKKYREARTDGLIGVTGTNSKPIYADNKEALTNLFEGLANQENRKIALDRGIVPNTEKAKEQTGQSR